MNIVDAAIAYLTTPRSQRVLSENQDMMQTIIKLRKGYETNREAAERVVISEVIRLRCLLDDKTKGPPVTASTPAAQSL